MRSYRAPKNKLLRQSYATARRLADRLGIRAWHHHPRAYNCMADAAANAAMDSVASSQVNHPTNRPSHVLVFTHIFNLG